MQQKGEELLEDVIYWCNWLRQEVNRVEKLHCLSKEDIGRDGIFDIDSTRITVNFSKLDISGTRVDELLRSKFKLQVEMADLYNIVAICTVGDNVENIKKLAEAINIIAQKHIQGPDYIEKRGIEVFRHTPIMKLLPWEAVYLPKEEVAIQKCIGKICGEMIIPYPPGIPIIMPGEIISKDIIDYALECRSKGIKINGTKDASLEYITVVK
jgi:ornithine decarboxylase